MIEPDVDVLIIGGGLVGALLLLALRSTPLRVRLIDSSFHTIESPSFDARSLALSPASLRLLKTLNCFSAIEPFCTPIQRIHISEQGAFGQTYLDTPEPLGQVIELCHLQHALLSYLPASSMQNATCTAYDADSQTASLQYPDQSVTTCRTRILVAADGSQSTLRQYVHLDAHTHLYPHEALVANIGLARAHQGIAYERFTTTGPLALLPLCDQRAAMVWSLTPEEARYWQTAPTSSFLTHLQQAFGYRLGRFIKVGARARYPLQRITMPTVVKAHAVFIGNAAQTLHPVAGQGLNLGLRDVATLAQCLVQYGPTTEALSHYEQARQNDRHLMTTATHHLLQCFSRPAYKKLRGLGLLALDNASFTKHWLIRYASGFGGIVPDLMCGLPLESV